MEEHRVSRQYNSKTHSPSRHDTRDPGLSVQKRHARVTVKYNRKELQKRLDVEKWIEGCLDKLYQGKEEEMPEEVNIDDILDLPTYKERVQRLKEILHTCSHNTDDFIKELLQNLEGLHKQEELQNDGIEHPHLHGYPHHHLGQAHHH